MVAVFGLKIALIPGAKFVVPALSFACRAITLAKRELSGNQKSSVKSVVNLRYCRRNTGRRAAAIEGMWLMERVHGTCIAIDGEGVLLRGPSGSGKSDLALRMIDNGAVLVGDDQLQLSRSENQLIARAPDVLSGQLEIRGLGIVPVASVPQAPLLLVIDLVPADQVLRFPETGSCTYLGIRIPLLSLAAFEASAPAKLRQGLVFFRGQA